MNAYQQSSFTDFIVAGLGILNIRIENDSLAILQEYSEHLTQWNEKLNLTSLHRKADVAVLHFLDSMAVLKVLPFATGSLLDIGSGSGFPGLVLKIAQPRLHVWLLDPDPRRIVFLKSVVAKLRLSDVHFLCIPFQDLSAELCGEAFDAVTTRGLSLKSGMVLKIHNFIKPNSFFIRMLGPRSLAEPVSLPGFHVAGYWAGYLPIMAAYRRVIAYSPTI